MQGLSAGALCNLLSMQIEKLENLFFCYSNKSILKAAAKYYNKGKHVLLLAISCLEVKQWRKNAIAK
jgi:hypothetical protein